MSEHLIKTANRHNLWGKPFFDIKAIRSTLYCPFSGASIVDYEGIHLECLIVVIPACPPRRIRRGESGILLKNLGKMPDRPA